MFISISLYHRVEDGSFEQKFEDSGTRLWVNTAHVISVQPGKRYAKIRMSSGDTLITLNSDVAAILVYPGKPKAEDYDQPS